MTTVPLYALLCGLFLVFITGMIAGGIFNSSSSPSKSWYRGFGMISGLLLAAQGLMLNFGSITPSEVSPWFLSLAFLPPYVLIFGLLFIRKLGTPILSLSLKHLTLIQVVRIPIELMLFWLISYRIAPESLTFSGQQWGIIVGITAPIIWLIRMQRMRFNKRILFAWNALGLMLLINWLVVFYTSLPTGAMGDGNNFLPFQFPFIWIPGYVIPLLAFAHIYSMIHLVLSNKKELDIHNAVSE